VDRGGFWFRVLVARYGEEAERLEVGGRSVSFWWREIAKIRDGNGVEGGGWFDERVARRVGNGSNTLFCYDRWIRDVPLFRRFDRLFGLALNKLSTVSDMFTRGWEVGGDAWRWRRPLWGWEEEMLGECRLLLNTFVVHTDVFDRWQWLPNIGGGYTMCDAYQILTFQVAPSITVTDELVWHKHIPLKVSILAWRLLRDRLPTKTNLLRHVIVHSEAIRCAAGCGLDETAHHLFLHCEFFGGLWQHIRNWVGISGVDLFTIHDHFYQFTNSIGGSTKRRSFMQMLCLLCVHSLERKK